MFVWSENGYTFKKPGLEIGVKNDFFGLKLGKYLENRMLQPHQEFLRVPPRHHHHHHHHHPVISIFGGELFSGGLKIGYIFCLQIDELITVIGGLINGGLRYKIK